MAVLYTITSPVAGSLKIQNSSASPQSNYLCNNQTVNVQGDPFYQAVSILNSNQQTIIQLPLLNIATIAASTPVNGFSLQQAVTEIANLIMH